MVNQLRHPQHEQISRAVRDWFRLPFEGMGYRAVARPFGTYWNTGLVFPGPTAVDDPAGFQTDLWAYYGPDEAVIVLDDPELEEQLGPILVTSGWTEGESDIFLAHIGPVNARDAIPGLLLEPVTDANLRDYALAGLVGFGAVEATPDEERLLAELARRRQELAGDGRALLARVHGVPAGIMRWFDDPHDIWINGLAVRPAFRGQGIGGALVRRCLVDVHALDRRSLLINVAIENNGAQRLYRRLGFHDEVYRRRMFLPPGTTED